MEVIRLDSSNNRGWALYPLFEDRVQKFTREFLVDTSPLELANTLLEMRNRWVNQPIFAGYFLAIEGGEVVGHLAAWLAGNHLRAYPFLYQAKTIPDPEIRNGFFDLMEREWIPDLREAVRPLELEFFQFETFRDERAWIRFFEARGYKAVKTRTVIRVSLERKEPARSVPTISAFEKAVV